MTQTPRETNTRTSPDPGRVTIWNRQGDEGRLGLKSPDMVPGRKDVPGSPGVPREGLCSPRVDGGIHECGGTGGSRVGLGLSETYCHSDHMSSESGAYAALAP